jgi:peptidoglycan glycosyltransferase
LKQLHNRFRLLVFIIIGLLLVAGLYGAYSVDLYGTRWFSSVGNVRARAAKSEVIAGNIIDRNGVTLATTDENGDRVYQSNLQSRSAVVHLLGDRDGNVANGVDSFQSSYLLGFKTSLSERVEALLKGETRHGDNVILTVDSVLCTRIVSAFETGEDTRDKCGAAVVMNYKTGEVLALVSLPVFDPQDIDDEVKNDAQHPFWNRAVQSTLAPGSTFKIVTAASALENLDGITDYMFTCTGATKVMDQYITDYGNAQHGRLSLKKAFRVSCNNAFAQCALMLKDDTLRATAEDFGFNDNFLFRDLVVENSVYPTEDRNDVEVAWSGVGQSGILATPMHMCMVAAGVANDGVMMEPRLLLSVKSPAGTVRLRFTTNEYRRAVDTDIDSTLQSYMLDVVASGTGTAAQVSGLTIAGKTGSAEASENGEAVTNAWFVGYIKSDSLPYACCVLVEDGGSGGSVAAPIAATIFEYLKDTYGN